MSPRDRPVLPDLDRDAWRERASSVESEVYATYLALRDPRTPLVAKAVGLAVVAYAVSPLDPIPDVLPLVGYLDELLLLPVGIALVRRFTPEAVLADCRERAAGDLEVGRARWAAAAVVVLVWAVAAVLVLEALVGLG